VDSVWRIGLKGMPRGSKEDWGGKAGNSTTDTPVISVLGFDGCETDKEELDPEPSEHAAPRREIIFKR